MFGQRDKHSVSAAGAAPETLLPTVSAVGATAAATAAAVAAMPPPSPPPPPLETVGISAEVEDETCAPGKEDVSTSDDDDDEEEEKDEEE